jgi:hypothetical protein
MRRCRSVWRGAHQQEGGAEEARGLGLGGEVAVPYGREANHREVDLVRVRVRVGVKVRARVGLGLGFGFGLGLGPRLGPRLGLRLGLRLRGQGQGSSSW